MREVGQSVRRGQRCLNFFNHAGCDDLLRRIHLVRGLNSSLAIAIRFLLLYPLKECNDDTVRQALIFSQL